MFEWLFGKMTRVSARKDYHAGYEGIEDFLEARMEFEISSANMISIPSATIVLFPLPYCGLASAKIKKANPFLYMKNLKNVLKVETGEVRYLSKLSSASLFSVLFFHLSPTKKPKTIKGTRQSPHSKYSFSYLNALTSCM